jgi:hypothetical protein
MIAALGAFSSSISLTLFFSCEEQKETERGREQFLSRNALLSLSTAPAQRAKHTKHGVRS